VSLVAALTTKEANRDAHSHDQVVPSSWQHGGPITLASDTTGEEQQMRIRIGAAFVAVAALVGALSPSPAAAGSSVVLDLQLDERPGATVAADASGMGHDGAIGTHVTMKTEAGVSFADFDRHPPDEGVAYGADHLILVPDAPDASLDPGDDTFTVEMRFRTKEKFGNILQKGQATTKGGQVKLQIPKGKLSCMYKSPTGRSTATSGALLLNDNLWHTIVCTRTSGAVTLSVDGVQVGRNTNPTGKIDNVKPWTLGGKLECDAVTVTCDYFPGELDYVRLSKG
jgi:hypothetical protein